MERCPSELSVDFLFFFVAGWTAVEAGPPLFPAPGWPEDAEVSFAFCAAAELLPLPAEGWATLAVVFRLNTPAGLVVLGRALYSVARLEGVAGFEGNSFGAGGGT